MSLKRGSCHACHDVEELAEVVGTDMKLNPAEVVDDELEGD